MFINETNVVYATKNVFEHIIVLSTLTVDKNYLKYSM
jgi:hypothetical protein